MQESDSLALGLTVGILALFCLLLVLAFYIRNRRRQKQEDLKQQEIDLELQDNQSFTRFHEQLNKQSQYSPSKSNTTKQLNKPPQDAVNQYTVHKEGSFNSSGSTPSDFSSRNRNTSTNTNTSNSDHQLDITEEDEPSPQRPGHQKTSSAYDFYESFIPILPEETEPSVADSKTNLMAPPTPKFKLGHKSSDSMEKLASSSTSSVNDKANHMLAKQLNNQALFEKLPSRAGTIKPPPVIMSSNTRSNSSTSLDSYAVEGHDAINDSYIYKGNGTRPAPAADEKDDKLANILGGNFDNSFRNDGNEGDVVYK